ncbi:MAG: twin-arginine translocase subunit TatC [Thermoguttaceae bacterium]
MPQSPAESDLFQDSTMTFGQHLEELRICLFRAIVGLAIGCTAGFFVGDRVVVFITTPVESALKTYYEKEAAAKAVSPEQQDLLRDAGYTDEADLKWIQDTVAQQNVSFEIVSIDAAILSKQLSTHSRAGAQPKDSPESGHAETERLKKIVLFRPIADDPRIRMNALNSQEAFVIWMKASLLVGIVLSSPWVFYQIWTFVAAGLYPHERRYVHLFLPVSIGLFLAGASTAFFFAFKQVLNFLLSFNHMLNINPELRINEWMSFVLMLPLGFGVSFQLPLVMLFLERIGLFTVNAYLASWRMAVLVIFVLAMILTPTGDPYTMLLMAGPLTFLYFGGVLLCKLLPKAKSRFAE